MTTPMKTFNSGQILPAELYEPVVIPQQYPACMHNRRRSMDADSQRVTFDLNPNYTAHPKEIKDFLRNILCLLRLR